MYHKINTVIESIKLDAIEADRKVSLQLIIDYIQGKKDANEEVNLNFICTHNSRRSQLSQVWGKVFSTYFNIPVNCFSGGVEVTAFDERAILSLERFGFDIQKEGSGNWKCIVNYDYTAEAVVCFSKTVTDQANPTSKFAAIMTCDHADQNCPVVAGADARLSFRFVDPKLYDETAMEHLMYDYRSFQIATDLMYIFSMVK
jgi:arsenate reductase